MRAPLLSPESNSAIAKERMQVMFSSSGWGLMKDKAHQDQAPAWHMANTHPDFI